MAASRYYRQQVVASVALTVGADGKAEGALSPVVIGRALGCRVVHEGSSLTLTIKDENGYDVLGGNGAVFASSLSLYSAKVGDNPCWKTLTARIVDGTEGDTATVYLYILCQPTPKQGFS